MYYVIDTLLCEDIGTNYLDTDLIFIKAVKNSNYEFKEKFINNFILEGIVKKNVKYNKIKIPDPIWYTIKRGLKIHTYHHPKGWFCGPSLVCNGILVFSRSTPLNEPLEYPKLNINLMEVVCGDLDKKNPKDDLIFKHLF